MNQTDYKEIEDMYEVRTYARYPVVFERGEGIYLFDDQGKKYVDLYGGHCVAALGHSPQRVIDALHKQSKDLMFYSNVVYSPIRARAAQKIIEMSPDGFDKVFFCNSGTEANENAIKISWRLTGKQRIVAAEGAFHGRTLASLAVTWSKKLREPYNFALPSVSFVPFGDANALEKYLSEHNDVAAFILEPIQSIAGCTMADFGYYEKIREICTRHGVMLIFDEIQTGVGRTGKFSFCEHTGMKPDIITLAKSLGSGFPVAAVLMPDSIAEQINIGDLGSTFAGGMLASAACLATLEVIDNEGLMSHTMEIYKVLEETVGPQIKLKGMGCLIGIELPTEAKQVVNNLFQKGWITGTSDHPNVLRIMPPMITPLEVVKSFGTILMDEIYA